MLWLIGMMGSGKTTVGRAVASARRLDFVDIDVLIASVTESSITDLWATNGETVFRGLERSMMKSAASDADAVVATGGGVVLDPGNIDVMRGAGMVVWLQASPETLAARIGRDSGRPLLAGSPDPVASLTGLLAERESRYAEAAHTCVDTGGRSIDSIVSEVLDLWPES